MYRYRNKKTGTVVKTHCEIKGKNWESVQDPAEEDAFEEDTFEEDTLEEDTIEEDTFEETSEQAEEAEETPAGKPKTSRRSKK